ncbi:MAG TPA: hypothetical protein VFK42_18185 [Acidimicrobiales bacterium]|nr:hypothetical protein [Acidimicrobiales bacterium]
MIVLLLGVATVAAFVRAGDDDGGSRLAQTGPGTTVTTTSTSTTSTSVPVSTSATAPTATTPPATAGTTGGAGGASGARGSGGTTATTAAPATNEGSSGLGTGGAGQVAMGPTIPNTGIESALAPAVALLGAGVGLRLLLGGRRRPHDA